MNAIARFATWGNSLAVRIPSNVAREAHIVAGTCAQLSVIKGKLVVAPIDKRPVYKITDLVAGITDENRHVEVGTGHAQGGEFA
jgi:antitoxin MazE